MKLNVKATQIILIIFGLVLIIATYILYPEINKQKLESQINKNVLENNEVLTTEDNIQSETKNFFKNVEYQGKYGEYNSYILRSEDAFIFDESPDVVFMNNLVVTLYLKDNRKVFITSSKGKYNKKTHDIFCEKNVKATDNETTLLSDNLDLLSTEDTARVYNSVVLKNDKGHLEADQINYNFNTKNYKISMFDKKRVKVKLIR
tara:strand:+ start:516 stop:1127 length:612 start_codon:yes stop_codon:yes gene_type:complete